MRLKTALSHKETTYRKTKRHEEQIQSLLKNLKVCVNPFHGEARNTATVAEMPISTVSGGCNGEIRHGEMDTLVR